MEKLKSQPQRRISTAQNIQDENKDSLSNANKESEQLLKNSQMQKLTIADDQSSQQLMVYQQRSLAQIFDEADLKWDPDEQILWDKVQRLEELIDNLQLKENDIPELFEFTYSDEPMRKYFAVDCFSKILDSIFEKKQDHFELSEEICEKLSGILVQTIEIEQNILLVVILFIYNLNVQANAARCMSFLIQTYSSHLNIYPSEKVIVRVVEMIPKSNDKFKCYLMGILQVVSVHQAQSRDLVIKAGAVRILSKIINKSKPSTDIFFNSLSVISDIFFLYPKPDVNLLEVDVQVVINALLSNLNEDCLFKLLWIVLLYCEQNKYKKYFYESEKALKRIIELIDHNSYVIFNNAAVIISKLFQNDDQFKTKILIDMGAIETLLNNLCYENLSKIFEIDILDLVNYYKNIDINKVIWFTLRSITKNSEYCVERFLQSRALDRMLITFEYDKFTNIHLAVSALEPIMDRILFQEAQQIIEKGILKGLIEVLLCPKEMEGQIGTHCIFKLLELTRDHYNKTEQSEKFVDILDEYGLPEYFLQCKQAYSPGSGLRQIDYVLKEFCGQQNNEYEEWKNHQFRDNKQHDFNYQIFEF